MERLEAAIPIKISDSILSTPDSVKIVNEMNSVLADLRKEREERQKTSGHVDVISTSTGAAPEPPASSGAKRRKQSAPRRIVRDSENNVVAEQASQAGESTAQAKRMKGLISSEQNTESIDLTEPDVPQKKPRAKAKPKENEGRAKKSPLAASSVEFVNDAGSFNPDELARECL